MLAPFSPVLRYSGTPGRRGKHLFLVAVSKAILSAQLGKPWFLSRCFLSILKVALFLERFASRYFLERKISLAVVRNGNQRHSLADRSNLFRLDQGLVGSVDRCHDEYNAEYKDKARNRTECNNRCPTQIDRPIAHDRSIKPGKGTSGNRRFASRLHLNLRCHEIVLLQEKHVNDAQPTEQTGRNDPERRPDQEASYKTAEGWIGNRCTHVENADKKWNGQSRGSVGVGSLRVKWNLIPNRRESWKEISVTADSQSAHSFWMAQTNFIQVTRLGLPCFWSSPKCGISLKIILTLQGWSKYFELGVGQFQFLLRSSSTCNSKTMRLAILLITR